MQATIPPVDKKVLAQELNSSRFIRNTNNGDNEIYIITHHDSPNVMQEIARLRELTFRHAGGGTGHEIDIDLYDTTTTPYKQLIVWNPEEKVIVGGYRFIQCADAPVDNKGIVQLATTELFNFSEKFLNNYLPYTIELGRSFVQPQFQPAINNRKGIFSLDNLWDGLGALIVDNPEIKYFFGKVTMYSHFNEKARDMILHFMLHYFKDGEQLVTPIKTLQIKNDMTAFEAELKGKSYKEGHLLLNQHVRNLGEHIPPLFNAYMNLSLTMKSFGTALNEHFGEVEETGILVTIADIYPTKKERHVNSYLKKVI